MEKYVFGADIGGTTVKIGVFTVEGELKSDWEIPTNTEDHGRNILPDIAASVKGKVKEMGISDDQVQGVGIGVPGPVSEESVVNKCVNLGWETVNVSEIFKYLTGFETKVGNDANVAALGEMWQGGGKGHKNMVMITLGTGVGSGIIIDEKIVSGNNGAGGEVGHMCLVEGEEDSCGCGKHGCLEQYASANGLVRVTKHYLADHPEEKTTLTTFDPLTAKDICDQAKAGDQVAKEMVTYSMTLLGKGMAYIACVTDPEAFVIGGGLSKAGEIITETAQAAYKKYAFHSSVETPFKLATLGNQAGIYGAARLVL